MLKDLKIFNGKEYNWIIILLSVIICIVIFITNFKIEYIYENKGIVLENNIVKLSVLEKDVKKITKNKELIFDGYKYSYSVQSISDLKVNELYLTNYVDIFLKINLKAENNIYNNIIDLKIKYDKKRITKIIIDFILGKEN